VFSNFYQKKVPTNSLQLNKIINDKIEESFIKMNNCRSLNYEYIN